MTLESQYKSYLRQHPECNYTFDEWMEKVMKPFVESAIKQIEKIEKEKK
jgi:hypothetical protein